MFSFCVFSSMSCKLVLLIIVLHVFLIVVWEFGLERIRNWSKQNTQIALREKFADERNKQRVPFQAFSIFGIGPDLIFGVCFVHRGPSGGGTSWKQIQLTFKVHEERERFEVRVMLCSHNIWRKDAAIKFCTPALAQAEKTEINWLAALFAHINLEL